MGIGHWETKYAVTIIDYQLSAGQISIRHDIEM